MCSIGPLENGENAAVGNKVEGVFRRDAIPIAEPGIDVVDTNCSFRGVVDSCQQEIASERRSGVPYVERVRSVEGEGGLSEIRRPVIVEELYRLLRVQFWSPHEGVWPVRLRL